MVSKWILSVASVVLALSFPVGARAQTMGEHPTEEPDPGTRLVVNFEEGKKLFSVNEAARIDEFVDRNRAEEPDRVFYFSGISRNSLSEEIQMSRDRVGSIMSYLMRRFRISKGHLLSMPELLVSKGQAPDSLANCVIIEYK